MGLGDRSVTDTELRILEVLWARGTATRREIMEILYPGGDRAKYATVQSLLNRLEAEGFASGDNGKVRGFKPAISREKFLTQQLRVMADKLCEGSLTPLLTTLIHEKLSAGERQEVFDLIEELERKGRSKKKPS